ncbi:MAG: hypothetical protein H6708_05855 [Kofleriaceae bacterium]|nr:hypothetical protein [Kofleriaceae bacterium]
MNRLRLPAEGLDHPTFDTLEPDQNVNVILVWREPLDEQLADQAVEVMQAWFDDDALWDGCEAEDEAHAFRFQTSFSSAGVMFTLANTIHPREPLRALIARLGELGIEAREELFGVAVWDEDAEVERSAPEVGAPAIADDLTCIEDHWRACFDLDGPQPAPELAGEVRESASEMRLNQLHVPGLRICYATLTPNFLPPDDRATEVLGAVDRALTAVFHDLAWPRKYGDDDEPEPTVIGVLDRDGEPATHAERIFRAGRVGYSLAVLAQDLRVGYPRQLRGGWAYRFREHEMFTALRAAIEELGLEPVVLWKRFADGDGELQHFEFQLWERLDAPATARARAEVAALRAQKLADGGLAVTPLLEEPEARPAQLVAAATCDVPGAADLPEGSLVHRGPGAWHLGLVPDDEVDDGYQLWALGPTAPRRIDAPASGYYGKAARCAFLPGGTRCVVATSCAVRVVDLEAGRAWDRLRSFGFEEVVALADGLALVRGSVGEHYLFPDEPDVVAAYEADDRDVPDEPEEVDEPSLLYLIDTAEAAEPGPAVQTLPCRAGGLTAILGGTVVVVWTPYEEAWRTAILALKGGRLHVLATLREALPDVREVGGKVYSSTCVELLHAAEARDALEVPADGEPDLEAIAPDE